jgi:hypothetical protein
MCGAYPYGHGGGGVKPFTRQEVVMQQSEAGDLLGQQVRLIAAASCRQHDAMVPSHNFHGRDGTHIYKAALDEVAEAADRPMQRRSPPGRTPWHISSEVIRNHPEGQGS